MKKHFILITILLFFGASLFAQTTNSRDNVGFGLKAGINISNVWDENGSDFRADPRAGFAGGVFLGIPFGKMLGFQPELLISQKGFQGFGTLLGTNYSFSKTTTYLDIPLQLQIKPVSVITVVFGPQYSYLLHEKNVYSIGSISSEQVEEFNNDNIRKNILGFVGGLDLNISHFVISGRAGWDLLTNHGDGTSSTPRYKNQWVQLTLGYKL